MKCVLMNKNTEVLLADYDSVTGVFTSVDEVYNIDYAPYILRSYYLKDSTDEASFRSNLSSWFRGRGIPSWRDKLDILLHKYQSYTGFSDIRINRLCILLNRQINGLKELQSLA